jgi:hypothetical protein
MKYVCTDGGALGRRYRVFPDYEKHADVAKEMGGRVLSAGLIHFDDDDGSPMAYSRSESLDIESDPQRDTDWLRMIWSGV